MKVLVPSKVEVEIDIELPYYYKHDLYEDYGENIIYGKIEADQTTTVQLNWNSNRDSLTIEVEITKETPQHSACYFEDQYKSNAEEFLQAVESARATIYGIRANE